MNVLIAPYGGPGWTEKQRILEGIASRKTAPPFLYNDVLVIVPSSRLRRTYGKLFLDSMGSFGELTDSNAMNVKPATVKLVHLDQPMSLADFNARYPSTAKPETIALINGLDKGAQLAAGYAKQIVGGTSQPQ